MNKIPEAKKLLTDNHIPHSVVSPQQLAIISNQLNKSLEKTLNLIAYLKTSGSNFSQFPNTAKVLTGEYS